MAADPLREPLATTISLSAAKVGLVKGPRRQLSNETADILRSHLLGACGVLAVALTFAFVRNWVVGDRSLLASRTVILVVLIGCLALLLSRISLSLPRLRLMELIVFGVVGVHMAIIVVGLMLTFSARGDASSTVSVQHLNFTGWAVLILLYGIFMPNTWQRAAAIVIPAAFVPYIVNFLVIRADDRVAEMLSTDQYGVPVPMPFIAATASVYAAHLIHSIRSDEFKARQFGQYQLHDKLGEGGMGEVYRAEHVLLKRPCAVKLIQAGDQFTEELLARFEKEVRSTAMLSHWNTVEIYDFGRTAGGTFYYVMELLPGMSLDDLVQKHGALAPERVVHFLRQICGAIREAHANGLIHRDLKPANIFAAARGGVRDVAKVLDFGLVRQVSTDVIVNPRLTVHGTVAGSPLYMPPEQVTSFRDADARSDLYSLGGVAYFLLTGRPPFLVRSASELIVAHSRGTVVEPSVHNPSVPADIERIVMRCLAKNPADRFPDINSLDRALGDCACAGQWTDERAANWWRDAEPGRRLDSGIS